MKFSKNGIRFKTPSIGLARSGMTNLSACLLTEPSLIPFILLSEKMPTVDFSLKDTKNCLVIKL